MSELQSFLSEQASEGEHQDEGGFTLDLAKAADKLAAFALPSHSHYLLKLIQVAHHLLAEQVEVRIESHRTVLRFHAPLGGSITDPEAVYRAFCDPLEIKDPLLKELVSGLIGTIDEKNLESLWSFSEGHHGRRVFINKERRFSIEKFTLSKPRDPDLPRYTYTLSVLHPKSWKFWVGGKRRAEAAKLLEEQCIFCGMRVKLDGRELPVAPTSLLNAHLTARIAQDLGYQTFYTTSHLASTNVLYQLAGNNEQCFNLLRPSLSAYVVREGNLNLWAQGTRVNNTLPPDGVSSMAWMLQFVNDRESLSMRHVPKRVPCKAVLMLNRGTRAEEYPLRVKVVRSGILVLDKSFEEDDPVFDDMKGCVLAFHDNELETDLTGLQVLEDQAFEEKVLGFKKLLPQALAYVERAKPLLSMP